jgi:hypothetical protein
MALFTENEVRARARQSVATDKLIKGAYASRSAGEILREATESFSEAKAYDIFLSHSIKDEELILGIKAILEDLKYTVYVDWIEDPQLDRSKVTPATASKLRGRMNSSKSLLYVTTENAENSKWMPWECGYFDGLKEKVAIVPVKASAVGSYAGQEYLGLYPYCVKERSTQGNDMLWIHKDAKTYTSYDYWVKTKNANIEWKTT